MKAGLTLVVPVYNEIGAIENSIIHLKEIKKNCKDFNFEIIIVNDGSTDGTETILKGITKDKDLKVVHHPKNRGYGAALKTGIKASQYPYIAITDADATYPDERIPEFFRDVVENDLDMLVGARTGESVKIPLIRKPPKWVINQLANFMTGTKIPDLNSGLRIMKKEVVERFIHFLPDGFSFTSTITISMLAKGYQVKYVPINYHQRKGKSKIRPFYDTLNFVKLIIRTVMFFDPLKVFLPISLPLLIGGFIFIIVQLVLYKNIDTISVLITLSGLNILTVGMLAEMIANKN
ncbi:MAG TPA: glycosyltransferase family 2 protein [Spirochaetota bacterium]|nr:glycosyltransferase family 2 protein [Spirochaetota bacterium]HPF07522.1 glycosyltransferase family 2 protein [Spirochaetota bacterium]HPJ42201.1 glycosyltransferase family 2 protein [Spirochaetota bacterium]HPR37862.1 glycosyltransferase family 2 protein [Spirochaetota bacterium]HRX48956.1 glycosyltransferase family 2 protein [Spirochaetota bacterium]